MEIDQWTPVVVAVQAGRRVAQARPSRRRRRRLRRASGRQQRLADVEPEGVGEARGRPVGQPVRLTGHGGVGGAVAPAVVPLRVISKAIVLLLPGSERAFEGEHGPVGLRHGPRRLAHRGDQLEGVRPLDLDRGLWAIL
jgi:hypothetical protein